MRLARPAAPTLLALCALLPVSACALTGSADDRILLAPVAELTFADLADLALGAPVVAEATVGRVTPVRDAPTAPGMARGLCRGRVDRRDSRAAGAGNGAGLAGG